MPVNEAFLGLPAIAPGYTLSRNELHDAMIALVGQVKKNDRLRSCFGLRIQLSLDKPRIRDHSR